MSLERRVPLRAAPRSKGGRGEREVVDLLRANGWTTAQRNWRSGAGGGGDIIGGPPGVHIECKRRERCEIWSWIAQAEAEARPTDLPAVFFRRNRSQWYVAIPADELLALLKLRES